MTKQQKPTEKTNTKAALAILDQAFEYYAPSPLAANTAPAYDDMPFGR